MQLADALTQLCERLDVWCQSSRTTGYNEALCELAHILHTHIEHHGETSEEEVAETPAPDPPRPATPKALRARADNEVPAPWERDWLRACADAWEADRKSRDYWIETSGMVAKRAEAAEHARDAAVPKPVPRWCPTCATGGVTPRDMDCPGCGQYGKYPNWTPAPWLADITRDRDAALALAVEMDEKRKAAEKQRDLAGASRAWYKKLSAALTEDAMEAVRQRDAALVERDAALAERDSLRQDLSSARAVCGEAPPEPLPGCIRCRHQRGAKCARSICHGLLAQLENCPVRQPVDDTPDAEAPEASEVCGGCLCTDCDNRSVPPGSLGYPCDPCAEDGAPHCPVTVCGNRIPRAKAEEETPDAPAELDEPEWLDDLHSVLADSEQASAKGDGGHALALTRNAIRAIADQLARLGGGSDGQ